MTSPFVTKRLLSNRYIVQNQIGEGGMALVFCVEDRKLGVVRAVKCLHPKWIDEPKPRQRFENEARLMAQLKDPHIVAVHDVDEAEGHPFMVMDWMEGGSVGDRLQAEGAMQSEDAIQVVRGVLKALHAAHARGVVHRDVKPQNVLLDRSGVPKLTDFGIARIDTVRLGLTETDHVMGTVSYMAPEQHMDAKDVDYRADLYACGAMLFALVTGRRPYALHQDALNSSRFQSLPEEIRTVVFTATRFQREERYESAQDMRQALEQSCGMTGQAIQITMTSSHTLGFDQVDPMKLADTIPPVLTSVNVPVSKASNSRVYVLLMTGLGLSLGVGSSILLSSWRGLSPAPVTAAQSLSESAEKVTATPVADPASPVVKPVPDSKRLRTGRSTNAELHPSIQTKPATPAKDIQPPPIQVARPITSTSTVFINAMPPAQLTIDGKDKGQTGWSGDISVGQHHIRLQRQGHAEVERTIQVYAERELRFCWDFKMEAPCARR